MKRIVCDIDPRLVAHRSDVIVDRALYHLAYVVPLASDRAKVRVWTQLHAHAERWFVVPAHAVRVVREGGMG